MPQYHDRRVLAYSPQQLYDLVIDVKAYPEFLPWCQKAIIDSRESTDTFVATLQVGYLFARERYTSMVSGDGTHRIQASYVHGPFKHLKNLWTFLEHPSGCDLNFHVEFEFSRKILNKLANHVLLEVTENMVDAFIRRAADCYGGGVTHVT